MATPTQAQAIAGLGLGGTYSVTATVTVGSTPTTVPVIGGTLRIDNGSYARRTLTLQVPQSYSPVASTDLLHAYGNEINLTVGFLPIGYPNYTPYVWQMGIFGINGFREQDDNVKTLEVWGADRADRYAKVGWDDVNSPITIAATTALNAAVQQVLSYLTAVDSGLTIKPLVTSGSMPNTGLAPIVLGLGMQGDPWSETISNLVQPYGMQLYIDPNGSPTLTPAAQPGQSVWTIQDGTRGTLLGFQRQGDNTGTVNYVIVDAEASYGQPWRGVAANNTVSSPTQFGQKFGKRYGHWVEPNISDQPTANSRANAILALNSVVPEYLTIDVIANPGLDVNQTITVKRGTVTRTAIINSIELDLATFRQTITARVLSVSR